MSLKVVFINRMMGISRGGGENVDLHLASSLLSSGCDIRFLVGRQWSNLRLPLKEFYTEYIRTPYLRGLMYRWEGNRYWAMRKFGSLSARIDLELFERITLRYVMNTASIKADLYQICGMPRLGMWLHRQTGRPVVIRWPGPPPLKFRDYALACSASISNGFALKEARKILGTHVREINIGVDSEHFHPAKKGDYWRLKSLPEDAVIVLFVGRLISMKNIPMLVKGFANAASQMENLYLGLVGEGPDAEKAQMIAKDNGVEKRLIMPGPLYGDALASAYASADIFAITTQPGYGESFPNVVLEAMSSGLPVIGTKVAAIPEQVVDRVNGFLIESGDVENLSQSILQLARDRNMRLAIGRTNRDKVTRNFDWSKNGRDLLKLYREFV